MRDNLAMRAGLILLVFSLDCSRDNPFFCNDPANASDPTCKSTIDASIDAPGPCTSNAQCTQGSALACDVAMGKCVQCTGSDTSACSGTMPVCDQDACRGCRTDAECTDSMFCDPDGSCAAASDVLYMSPAGSGSSCSMAAPCSKLSVVTNLVDATHTRLSIAAGTYPSDNGALVLIQSSLVIHGNNATIPVTGLAFVPSADAAFAIQDLTLHNGSNTGISCSGLGLTVSLALSHVAVSSFAEQGLNITSCDLTADRVGLDQNVKGGLQIDGGSYKVTNAMILGNGNGNTLLGGVEINSISTTGNVFALNTIALANSSDAAGASGIDCTGNTAVQHLSSNIVFGNAGTPSQQIKTDANCTFDFTDSDDTLGGTNITGNPNLTSDGQLTTGSPAIGAADPAITGATPPFDHDFFGNARPASGQLDIGADQFQ